MNTGTFFPDQSASTLFAMAGDDCSLHFDLSALTPKQRIDHESNEVLTALLQVALVHIGGRHDHIAMFDAFRQSPWSELLTFHEAASRSMGLEPVPHGHLHWHPRASFYTSVAAALPDVELVNLYMVSGSNAPLHQDDAALSVSRDVNSKLHFARHAPAFGLPVPDTLLTSVGELGSDVVAAFFVRHGHALMLKTLGLAGARNVVAVDDVSQAREFVAEYDDEMQVLLQARLDVREWKEMTVDLRISDDDVRIANVREILFADGLWVGNRIGADVTVTPEQERVLLDVGRYARTQGYSSALGCNCGVDYFVRGDETLVTEINCRWTGGLFPAEILRRLRLEDRNAVAFFDLVRTDALEDYRAFVVDHLHEPGGTAQAQPFSCVPIGFGPFTQELEGRAYFYVWHMVVGDYEAFKDARGERLGDRALITAERISVGL